MKPFSLESFVRESNRIENIHRNPTSREIDAHERLLADVILGLGRLETFVSAIQPGAKLRRSPGMDVRVGNHYPPRGSALVESRLLDILHLSNLRTPFATHHDYENLHPFMDGNGRSGRALWLRMMGGIERAPLGFLHHWYYQSLDAVRP
jgi:hypothetical protein